MNKLLKQPKCKNCWDKGYATELIGGYHVPADFIGEKSHDTGIKELKNFCSCEREKKMAKEAKIK